jgi:hypothetical protein
MKSLSPGPASSVVGLQDVKRLSRHKRERIKPLSHLFHGPLDILPAGRGKDNLLPGKQRFETYKGSAGIALPGVGRLAKGRLNLQAFH